MNLIDLISKHPVPVTRFQRPYVIAEAGVNHEGSMDIARRLIDEAALGGADAIKFQTYKAGTLASKHSPAYWDTSKEPTPSQYELFKKHDSFWKGEFENLKKHCDQAGIAFMSTPFDVESAKFLNDMMDVFKISSSDLTNRPFIEFMCDFKKPIIMSTGAASLAEIAEAVSWIEAKGNPLALLHCVLNYPTMDENAALGMIPALVRHFPQHVIGYSDHTLPNDMKVLEVATLLGAQILEKHFSHDKTLPGNDHYHAMDYKDLQLFRQNFERTLSMIGEMRIEALAAPSSPTATSPPGRSSTRTTSRGSVPLAASAPVTTMKCSAWPPAPTSRKIPSSSGRIWNKKRMCGKGLEKAPFPPPYPLRAASFPRIPHGRREWRAPATVNGKTIIEHSVRCVSIFLESGAIRRFPRRETEKRAHLAGRQVWGPREGRSKAKGAFFREKHVSPPPGFHNTHPKRKRHEKNAHCRRMPDAAEPGLCGRIAVRFGRPEGHRRDHASAIRLPARPAGHRSCDVPYEADAAH